MGQDESSLLPTATELVRESRLKRDQQLQGTLTGQINLLFDDVFDQIALEEERQELSEEKCVQLLKTTRTLIEGTAAAGYLHMAAQLTHSLRRQLIEQGFRVWVATEPWPTTYAVFLPRPGNNDLRRVAMLQMQGYVECF